MSFLSFVVIWIARHALTHSTDEELIDCESRRRFHFEDTVAVTKDGPEILTR